MLKLAESEIHVWNFAYPSRTNSKTILTHLIRLYLDESFELGETVQGKPMLLGSLGRTHFFNLSHCRATQSGTDQLLIGLAATPIGVDVERVRPLPNWEQIARRSLGFDDTERPIKTERGFFSRWTEREAWAKATGLGIDQLGILPELPAPEEGQILELRCREPYVGALALCGNSKKYHVKYCRPSEYFLSRISEYGAVLGDALDHDAARTDVRPTRSRSRLLCGVPAVDDQTRTGDPAARV